ncbi:hypothetical protein Kpol_181p4, partial [Vanderwaltozyma polyspora DSM 70294]
MSLITAVNDDDLNRTVSQDGTIKSIPSLTSSISGNRSRANSRAKNVLPSVYQTSGEPLSKEALYHAKLKYGVYQSPATGNSAGVPNVKYASDSAAQIANDTKFTIEAYKRSIDPNATKAAERLGKSVTEKPVSSKTNSIIKNTIPPGSKNAATKAYAKTISTQPVSGDRSKANSITSSVASASSALGSVSTKKAPKQKESSSTITPISKMDLSKVLKGAELKAEARIKERMTPERKNYSYGLKTKSVQTGQLAFNKDTMSNLSATSTRSTNR